MKTAPFITYKPFNMKREWLDVVALEVPPSCYLAPVDYQSIDAPEVMPAGSTRCHAFPHGGGFTDMPNSFSRAA